MKPFDIPLTDELRLRNIQASDAICLYQAIQGSMKELSFWEDWARPTYTPEHSASFCKAQQDAWVVNHEYTFLIVHVKTHRVIGGIALNQIRRDYYMGNVGYWIDTAFAGKGLTTAALKHVIDFGFQQAKLTRLELVIRVDNAASRRVAEKIGAHYEGIARNRLYYDYQPIDAAMYSLTPPLLNKR